MSVEGIVLVIGAVVAGVVTVVGAVASAITGIANNRKLNVTEKKLDVVHTLVNSNLTEVKKQLADSLALIEELTRRLDAAERGLAR